MWKIWFTIILSLLLVATSSASDFLCTIRDSQKQFAGINVTEICFWDFYNKSVAEFKFYGASSVQFPIGNLERLLIPGSKAHYSVQTTSITNTTLTSFPDTSIIYDKDSELNVSIRLKSNAEGLPIVLKFEDEKIEDWLNALQDNFGNFLQTITFEKIFNMSDYGYAFNATGWAKVKWNDSSKRVEVVSNTTGFNLGNNIIETIRINSIQLSDFWINDSSSGLPEELKTMSPGYYALLVISVNEFGNPTFKLIVPFVVLNGTAQNNKPSFSSTVTKGEKLVLNFNRDFGFAFALLLKNVSYDASIKVDLTKKITESLKANLTYSGKELEEIKLFDKNLGIFAPKGMFSYSYASGSNTLELETSALETGEYILYVISFEEDSVIPMFVGSLKVQVAPPTTPTPTTPPTTPTPTPTPPTTTPRPIGGGAGGGAVIPGVPIYVSPYIAVMAKERYEITMPSATQKDTNVLSIVVIPEENVNVRVRVEKLEKLPPGIPLPEGIVALILSVELTLSKETGIKGEINFVLKRDEIRNLGFDPDEVLVALLRFDEKQMRWIKLDTRLTGKDENYNYYRAEVPSFSYFAVILESPKPTPTPIPTPTPTPTPMPTPTPTPPPMPPGIEIFAVAILVAIIAIAAIAYFLKKRRK
ncbi:MAG: PGF-pre-PGF domain-containing protein [Archaeoglobaceae archaeon]